MGNLPDPDDIYGRRNYRHMKSLLAERVSPRRFEHSVGVAKCARDLARTYGYADPRKAKMAGILHDWDKGYDLD